MKKIEGLTLKEQSDVLKLIPAPVIVMNPVQEITFMNEEAEKYLELNFEDVKGERYETVFEEMYQDNEQIAVQNAFENKKQSKSKMTLFKNNVMQDVESYAKPIISESGEFEGVIELIFDTSDVLSRWKKLFDQTKTIQKMSTPTIKLWDQILLLPVVGVIDSERAQFMMENILNKISETFSKVIILDIQGVAAVDTAVANHLIKITIATNLMGCECILSGISPSVAQAIIQLGISMANVNTKANLSDALSEAYRLINKKVVDVERHGSL